MLINQRNESGQQPGFNGLGLKRDICLTIKYGYIEGKGQTLLRKSFFSELSLNPRLILSSFGHLVLATLSTNNNDPFGAIHKVMIVCSP